MTELVFSKVAGLHFATLVKYEFYHRYFSRIFEHQFFGTAPVGCFCIYLYLSQKLRNDKI